MIRLTYKKATAAAAFIPIALLAAGCSSGSGGGGAYGGGGATSSSAAPTSAASSSAASSSVAGGGRYGSTAGSSGQARGTAVTATEQEFSIALSAKTFKAGTYTFTIHNTGKFSHNLTIEGPGVDKQASPIVNSGATGTLTVALQKGSYELWCAVDGHKDRGMDLTIMVS